MDSQLWLGSAVVARKSYAALATRVCPLLGCAVLPATVVGGSNRSKTWSGGSTLTAPLPCKSRGSSGLAYWALQLVTKGDSTERSHLFGLMHDVCSKVLKYQKGAADTHVSYMPCHLYSYMLNMEFYPCHVARIAFQRIYIYVCQIHTYVYIYILHV